MWLILYNTDAVLICAGYLLLQLLAHLDPLPLFFSLPLRPELSGFAELNLVLGGFVRSWVPQNVVVWLKTRQDRVRQITLHTSASYSITFGIIWCHTIPTWTDALRRNTLFQQNAATPKSRVNHLCSSASIIFLLSDPAAMSLCIWGKFSSFLSARAQVLPAVASSLALSPAPPLCTREGKLRSHAELWGAKLTFN